MKGLPLRRVGEAHTSITLIRRLTRLGWWGRPPSLVSLDRTRIVAFGIASVKEASDALDKLMLQPPFYGMPWIIFFGGMASASICSVGFNGSLIDSLVSFPLGAFVVFIQLIAARNELYSNVFEYVCVIFHLRMHTDDDTIMARITMTTLMSFICGALSASRVFCFPAIVSSSIVLILPVRHLFLVSFVPKSCSISLICAAHAGFHRPNR